MKCGACPGIIGAENSCGHSGIPYHAACCPEPEMHKAMNEMLNTPPYCHEAVNWSGQKPALCPKCGAVSA